jgi:hypothetical protein
MSAFAWSNNSYADFNEFYKYYINMQPPKRHNTKVRMLCDCVILWCRFVQKPWHLKYKDSNLNCNRPGVIHISKSKTIKPSRSTDKKIGLQCCLTSHPHYQAISVTLSIQSRNLTIRTYCPAHFLMRIECFLCASFIFYWQLKCTNS